MSDSPMWNRGNRSRSNSATRRPRWASSVETVDPAGPPPITTTSHELSIDGCANSQTLRTRIRRALSYWYPTLSELLLELRPDAVGRHSHRQAGTSDLQTTSDLYYRVLAREIVA